ncbi:MAG: 4-hydroxythreonine-4-phosphate dehydrogenase PdxA [Deltaproteobacteria bacterium]|nr:MAG: 4-hydroxythreonine-4-phosphate dehydrogenase PdxA [Deltaproteobacteria bacterium]
MKPLILTPGDPLGVGPELAARVLAERVRTGQAVNAVLAGDGEAIRRACAQVALQIATDGPLAGGSGVAVVDTAGGHEPAEVAALRWAVDRIREGMAAGLVTGPIHKARLRARGFTYSGHTDFLADLCGVERPVMAFVGGQLRVALVTVHIPLRAVADALTIELVAHTGRVADAALRRDLRLEAPRIAVLGLNPHAGESGVLGREEIDVIGPAVEVLRAEGIDATGPVSAETAFMKAMDGHYDLVVAMYHDQGLAPLKLVDFGRSVNWTLGLPIVRTSVDHGTADDLAWTGQADPSSFASALQLAERLTSR